MFKIDFESCTFQFQLSVTCIQWEPCFSFHGVNLLDSSPRRPGPRNFITLSTRVWSKIIIKDLPLTNSYRYLFVFFFWKKIWVCLGGNPHLDSQTQSHFPKFWNHVSIYYWIVVIIDYGSVFVTYGKITEIKSSRKESSFPAKVRVIKLMGAANLQSPMIARKFLP